MTFDVRSNSPFVSKVNIRQFEKTKPSFSHFKRILLNKYQTERHISLKSNKTNSFRKKWRMFEETIL